jgi:PAS domain S-box-containing protein
MGALKTDYFVALQEAIRFGQHGHAVIVDSHGRLIAHPSAALRSAMYDLSQVEVVRRMRAGETGVSRFFSPEMQTDMIAGFTTVPKMQWGVMIPQPLAELQAHVRPIQRTVWTVIGVALMGTAICGWLVSRWLAAPLRRIGAVATRFANGAYEERVTTLGVLPPREATDLADQFNAMADEVQHTWQARQVSEQRFREFAHIAADWFWETDMQQVCTYISIQEKGWHNDTKDIIGRHRREFIVDDPEGQVTARLQAFMDRAEPFDDVVFSARGSDGYTIDVSVAGRPMYDTTGKLVGYRGVTRDITTHLRTTAQLRQAQREQQRQAQKMEAIGTLASGIAHDFNNILGAILGFVDLALRDVTPDQTRLRDNLHEVLTAGKRARDLVRHILAFSRKGGPERTIVHLPTLINEGLRLIRASLPSTIEIQQDIAHDVGTVLVEPTQIEQVLMNLCVNAAHAMRDTGGRLVVRLEAVDVDETWMTQHPTVPPGLYARLTVQDTGHGMTPEVQARIFEPFFTTKEVGQGTGLGLAVVYGIVTSHDGTITVQSTPNVGTTFAVYLPCIDQDAVGLKSMESTISSSGKGTVLFVDDEEALLRAGQSMLENLGYHVVVSQDSLKALQIFQQTPERFAVVITDQTMPQMTGEGLAHALRRIRPDIPVILCTGFSHTMDADRAQAAGINAFLMKPLLAHDLGAAIQRVTGAA